MASGFHSPFATHYSPISTEMRALRLHIDRIERLARGHEQAVALPAAEADIGAGLGQQDLSDARAVVWCEHLHAVIARTNPAGADPDIALGVDAHSVGEARLAVELHVDQPLRVRELWAVDVVRPHHVLG